MQRYRTTAQGEQMATTTEQNDFDQVKRWGKEFLAGPAGTGGTSQASADLTPRRDPKAMRAI
jgi:hypothetical protein